MRRRADRLEVRLNPISSKKVYWLTKHLITHLNHPFQICKPFLNQMNHYQEITTTTLPKIDTFLEFFCRTEVAGDVISR